MVFMTIEVAVLAQHAAIIVSADITGRFIHNPVSIHVQLLRSIILLPVKFQCVTPEVSSTGVGRRNGTTPV